jgi:hypothetical protein
VTTDSNTNAAEKSMSIRECLDAVHKAGGNAWDKVADPDGFIRWMRGSDDPKDVAAADQAMQSMPVQSPASAPEQASVGAETTTGWKVEDHGADGMIVRDPSGMERSRIGSFTMAMVHLAMVLEEHDKLRAALTQLPRQSEDGQELFYSVYVHEQGHKLWQADLLRPRRRSSLDARPGREGRGGRKMKWVASAWIEDSDTALVASVRKYGVRAMAGKIGLSPGMVSRWIRSRTGMGQNHVKHLLRAIKKPSAPPPTGADGEGEGRG